jgi:dTDP-4-amino-4,6-dideoxygalactose transaminase
LFNQMKILRVHGSEPKYYHKFVGGHFRLDALQAAVVRVKLKYLDGWTAGRQRNAVTYNSLLLDSKLASALGDAAPVVLPYESRETGVYALRLAGAPFADHRHIYNQYVLRVERRDALRAFLAERKIGVEIYYPVSLHQQECFADWGYQTGDFPASEAAAAETIALPIYPELSEAQLQIVTQAIAEFYAR